MVSLREQRWIGRDSERAVLLLQAGDWVPPALLSSAPAQLQRGSGRTRPSHSRPLHDWTGPRRLGWGKNHRIMMFGAVLALMHCCTCSLLNESCLSSCFSLLWFNSSIIQRYFWSTLNNSHVCVWVRLTLCLSLPADSRAEPDLYWAFLQDCGQNQRVWHPLLHSDDKYIIELRLHCSVGSSSHHLNLSAVLRTIYT